MIDIYGYPLQFNIKRQMGRHKTFVGGTISFFSIIFFILLLAFGIYKSELKTQKANSYR